MLILVINPGSTSDQVALFRDEQAVFHKVVRYSPKDLAPFDGKKITDQLDFRSRLVLESLAEHGVKPSELDAVVGRGGLVKPIPSGTYRVTEKLLADLRSSPMGDHASNLGGLIASSIALPLNKPAFIADPVVVDEMDALARYSGMPENPRVSIFHALNQKRVARHAARELGKKYEDLNLIVMHGGGGISIGAHEKGRVIDVNNALDGDGPFTPQRSGGVPTGGLAKLCYGGKISQADMKLKIKGRGGLIAYTGTSDLVVLEKFIEGKPLTAEEKATLKPGLTPKEAEKALEAMAYQIAKEISMMGAVLKGQVDAIVLTGGIAYSKDFVVRWIKERLNWLAPILVYPGGDEMSALREAAARVLSNSEQPRQY